MPAIDAICSVLLLIRLHIFASDVRIEQFILHLLFAKLVDRLLLVDLELFEGVKVELVEVIDNKRCNWFTLGIEHHSSVLW